MKRDMRAITITGPAQLRHAVLPVPNVGPGDLLIETAFVGVCGTDSHLLQGDSYYLKNGYLTYPFVFGHEYTGRIVAIGEEVHGLKIGDRVVGHCMVPCHRCDMCQRGTRHLCRSLKEVGLRYIQGAAADYVSVPAYAVTKLPSSLSIRAATLVEPAVTVYHAIDRVSLRPSDVVAVIGTGTLGLLALVFAKLTAARVDVIGIRDVELAVAQRLGACGVLHPKEARKGAYSVVLEASGASTSTGQAAELLDLGGRAALIGVVNQEAQDFHPELVTLKNLTIHGILHGLDYYTQTVELFASGRIDPTQLIERVGRPEDAEEIFAAMARGSRTRPKYMFEFAGEREN